MDRSDPRHLHCPLCGREHHPVPLRRGERARCVDCGGTLGGEVRRDSTLAFTITALILAIPAVQLPLVTVNKFGAEHASYVWTGVRALWQEGRLLLSVWVALCGIIIPLALLVTLTMLVTTRRRSPGDEEARFWTRLAAALQHWSMPEVQVLAILVAFVKIGALVQIQPGPGLWSYAAMTLAMLFAWRSAGLLEDEL